MRHYLSLFFTLSFLWTTQVVVASTNNDDDNDRAPAVAVASRAPNLDPNDKFSRFPTHVLRQIGDILLENDPQSFGRFLKVSRTTHALKDQIFHTTETRETVTDAGKKRTVMRYGGANSTKGRVLELLGRQTGNPDLFKKDHAPDYAEWSKTDLLRLLQKKTVYGALDPQTISGKGYFELQGKLMDTSLKELDYSWKYALLLCPPLRDATHLEKLSLARNQLTAAPDVSRLMNLRELNLVINKLTAAPMVTGLTNLRRLYLSHNQLTAAPDVTGLNNLIDLSLEHNQLTAAPDVTGLTNLKELYLNGNELTAAPVVTGLMNLINLSLHHNQLTIAPDVSGLMNLRVLYLDTSLCRDERLLLTLKSMNRTRDSTNKITFEVYSKNATGKYVVTTVSLD